MPSEKRERQRANRAKAQKKAGRKEQINTARRRSASLITAAVAIVAVFALFTWLQRDTSGEEATTSNVACGGELPESTTKSTYPAPQDQAIAPDATVTATITTSCGDIVLALDQGQAPETVNSFVFLAREGFYDGLIFHRVLDGFVIQGGDPDGNGTGGPGYRLDDELPPDGFVYSEGVLAMANSGPNSSGSQFFIVVGERGEGLQSNFTAFGNVVDGTDTLALITAVDVVPGPSGEPSLPLQTIYIESVTIDIS